jgi:hypothetical protein
VRRAILVFKGL